MGGCISTSLVDQDDSNRRLLSFAEDNNLDNQSYKNGNEIMQNEDEYDSVTILYDLYLNIKKWIIGKENANNRNLNNVGHEFCQKYHNVKSGFQSEVVQNTRFKIYKLPNIKNSCYMNSILQVLFSSKGINDRIRIYKSINMKENVNNMLETYLKLINTKDGINIF